MTFGEYVGEEIRPTFFFWQKHKGAGTIYWGQLLDTRPSLRRPFLNQPKEEEKKSLRWPTVCQGFFFLFPFCWKNFFPSWGITAAAAAGLGRLRQSVFKTPRHNNSNPISLVYIHFLFYLLLLGLWLFCVSSGSYWFDSLDQTDAMKLQVSFFLFSAFHVNRLVLNQKGQRQTQEKKKPLDFFLFFPKNGSSCVNCHWNQEEEKEARKLRCRHLHYYIHFLVSFGPFFSRNRLESPGCRVYTMRCCAVLCWPQV